MRLPEFLIIGAMKAGTTSLYRDLRLNPRLYLPSIKEPGCLKSDEVLAPEGRRVYARHFARARSDQVCGDPSTDYAKLPDIPGVPARARQVLGTRIKVIYLVREPVARIVSHHHHERFFGLIDCGIDEAVRTMPRFLDYTRYAMQIEPWRETFGPDAVRIVPFETYVADRRATVAQLSRFLGVAPRVEGVEPDRVFNPSAGRRAHRGLAARVQASRVYQRGVRRLLPPAARDWLRAALMPAGTSEPDTPSAATVALIRETLREDVEKLRKMTGLALWSDGGENTAPPPGVAGPGEIEA